MNGPTCAAFVILALMIGCGSAVAPTSAAQDDEMMSCERYLAEQEGSRNRWTGIYLWLSYLKPNADSISHNHAGSMIAGVPGIREVIDQSCAAEGGELFPIALSTIKVFGQAMMQDSGTQ